MRNRHLSLIFTLTLFLSAALLFLIQPLFAKMVLPLLGGSPSVWTTCMLFFQVALLAGYGYSNRLAEVQKPMLQVVVHLVVILLPFLVLPISIPAGWTPPLESNPTLWFLGFLTISIGLPFFAVATTAPLLQHWFSRTRHHSANDPYFLYAASNLGSLLALLSYPTLVEPDLALFQQAHVWAYGYGILVVLNAACMMLMLKDSNGSNHMLEHPNTSSSISLSVKVQWVFLAFIPSSLMLGLTTYISTDIASIPLLWVIPLALYLVSFVIVFAKKQWISLPWLQRLLPHLIILLTFLISSRGGKAVSIVLAIHCVSFFIIALVCHGKLALSRPSTRALTQFYLYLSIGGALGGLFNAIVAPFVFKSALEYPLVVALSCLVLEGEKSAGSESRQRRMDFLLPILVGLFVCLIHKQPLSLSAWGLHDFESGFNLSTALRFGLPLIVCFSFRHRPVRFALGIAVVILLGLSLRPAGNELLKIDRSFFGVSRVQNVELPNKKFYRLLIHGTTIHGVQSLDSSRRKEPLGYYYSKGPIGTFFNAVQASGEPMNVAVVGLGSGALAAYAKTGEHWDFYEIDPVIKKIATNPEYFTFLSDCLAEYKIVLGDGRLSLKRAKDQAYDTIVIDAFSSDAIPMHFVTKEAVQLFLNKTKDENGYLVFHISNRFFRLEPILGDIAESLGLASISFFEKTISLADAENGATSSHWLVMARSQSALSVLAQDARWHPTATHSGQAPVWTDDFSNILGALRKS